MPDLWVVNASPLIVLAKIGREGWLLELPDAAVVPEPVAREVLNGPEDDPARRCIASGHFPVAPDRPIPASLAAWDLDAGETAVLAVALADRAYTAVVDDAAARRCARALGVPVRGTLGVALEAKKRGLVPRLGPVLDQLRDAGLHVGDNVVREVLARVGE